MSDVSGGGSGVRHIEVSNFVMSNIEDIEFWDIVIFIIIIGGGSGCGIGFNKNFVDVH